MQVIGEIFGKDRVIELLGRGGMGSVWRTEHLELKAARALKLLPEDFARQPTLVERFEREARLMAQLRHPHIVQIHDFGSRDGRYYLVMEYLPGGSLRDKLRAARGPLEWRAALAILAQVADGLEYAHAKGVVHRDLKPENILFDEQGRAKIADFGLGKILENVVKSRSGSLVVAQPDAAPSLGDLPTRLGEGVTLEGTLVGTLEYMSPEQRRGEPVDTRTDLYALGVICFEMLTGRTPLGIEVPSEVNPEVPPHLDAFVKRLLAPAARRWANTAEVRAELQRLAIPAVTPTPPRPAPPAPAPAAADDPKKSEVAGAASPPASVPGARPGFTPRLEPFTFASGEQAWNKDQLLNLCARYPHEAIRHLRTGRLEEWLRYAGEDPLADRAAAIRAHCKDLRAGLRELITGRRPLILETGDPVDTPEQLLDWLREHPREGQRALTEGQIGEWLEYRGFTELAARARKALEAGGDPEAALAEFITGRRPLIFRTGDSVSTLEELWDYLRRNPAEGRHALYSGELERWLKYRGWPAWAERAARLRTEQPDRVRGLDQLLAEEEAERRRAAAQAAARRRRTRLLWGAVTAAVLGGLVLGIFLWERAQELERQRRWAFQAQAEAAAARDSAQQVRAEADARSLWDQAEGKRREAERALGAENFTAAHTAFSEATDFYQQARKQAEAKQRTAKITELLTAARAAEGQKDWKTVTARAREVLALAADHAEAKALLARAVTHLPMTASKETPWTNSLGMPFVPVPGTAVLFCIWETRVKDYHEFARSNSGVNDRWERSRIDNVLVSPSADCPVTEIKWEDARAFCRWLTQKERELGIISSEQFYRLPMDWEWSVAVGLKESREGSPMEKDGKVQDVYPWGTQWPPPKGAGNYADENVKRIFGPVRVIEGYDDGYAVTAPVGSFTPNQLGLHDLGGNVAEWCEDFYKAQLNVKVLRGASFLQALPADLLSSRRFEAEPSITEEVVGFRCVLVLEAETQ